MGGVEDDGDAELAHDDQAAHIDNQVAVAEGGAAFRKNDPVIAGRADLFDRVLHVLRGHELAFFYVDRFAGAAGFDKQVGLAAEEGGDLKDVGDFGGGSGLIGSVDVGEDFEVGGLLNGGQDAQTFFQAGAAVGGDAGAVGFIERSFKDVFARGLLDGAGERKAVLFRIQ